MEEEESAKEVLCAICHHATMPSSPDSFKDEVSRGSTEAGSLISHFKVLPPLRVELRNMVMQPLILPMVLTIAKLQSNTSDHHMQDITNFELSTLLALVPVLSFASGVDDAYNTYLGLPWQEKLKIALAFRIMIHRPALLMVKILFQLQVGMFLVMRLGKGLTVMFTRQVTH